LPVLDKKLELNLGIWFSCFEGFLSINEPVVPADRDGLLEEPGGGGLDGAAHRHNLLVNPHPNMTYQ
jgi:hypothetical protein